MKNDKIQLPAEVAKAERLKWDAKIKKGVSEESRWHFLEGVEEGAKSVATEYTSKLHQAQQEIEQLKRWKAEASELIDPILEYGQSKEAAIPLGGNIFDVILERCKRAEELQKQLGNAKDLLEKVIYRHEGGLLPDRLLYNQIKTFLDGKK